MLTLIYNGNVVIVNGSRKHSCTPGGIYSWDVLVNLCPSDRVYWDCRGWPMTKSATRVCDSPVQIINFRNLWFLTYQLCWFKLAVGKYQVWAIHFAHSPNGYVPFTRLLNEWMGCSPVCILHQYLWQRFGASSHLTSSWALILFSFLWRRPHELSHSHPEQTDT